MAAMHPSTMLLLDMIDEAFDRAAWHGATLRSSLRGVTDRQASWRPSRGRHSIRELTLLPRFRSEASPRTICITRDRYSC